MHPTELKFIQLARQIGAVGGQAAMAYEQAQAALRLDQVMTTERFATAEGTRQSLDTLAALAQLNQAHRDMFAKFMVAAMAQVTPAIKELPEDKARQYEEDIVGALNRQLASQAAFYTNRDKWIAGASDMFTMVDDQRDAINIIDGQLVFNDDASVERFNGLMVTLDEIHHLEVAQMTERVARVAAANALLDTAERGSRQ